jgi:hypothetical protein
MKWDKKLDKFVVNKVMREQRRQSINNDIDKILLILSIVGFVVLIGTISLLALKL